MSGRWNRTEKISLQSLPSLSLLLPSFSWGKPQKQEEPVKMPNNSVLMFLCEVFANITQTETFLKGPTEESVYIFYLTTGAATEAQGSFSAHDFLSLLTF